MFMGPDPIFSCNLKQLLDWSHFIFYHVTPTGLKTYRSVCYNHDDPTGLRSKGFLMLQYFHPFGVHLQSSFYYNTFTPSGFIFMML